MQDILVNVTHSQRQTFKKHFLNSVHCELGLSGVAAGAIIANELPFNDAFKKLGFLECSKIVRGHYRMEASEGQEATLNMQQSTEVIGLRFVSQKPLREVNVTSQNIVVSDNAYDGFEAFSKRLESYVSIFTALIGSELRINKTGLRKINSIIIEPVQSYAEACEVFNPVLFGALRSGLVRGDALKISEEVLVLEKQNKICVLRNALKALESSNAYEAILDFDFVDNAKYTSQQVLSDVLPCLNELHFDMFMWTITDALLEAMED